MNLEQLKNRDYYLVIDKSGSMEETDCPGGKSRWSYCQESVLAITKKLSEFDPDGVTVIPFASSHKVYPNTTPGTVAQVFQENSPMGSTFLTPALQAVFSDYLSNKQAGKAKANGAICLVVTDGAPSDPQEVTQAIINFGNKLDNGDAEFGIAFLQIGKDPHATTYLKGLDDSLTVQGAKYDIVDTKTIEEVESIGLVEAMVAALSD